MTKYVRAICDICLNAVYKRGVRWHNLKHRYRPAHHVARIRGATQDVNLCRACFKRLKDKDALQ